MVRRMGSLCLMLLLWAPPTWAQATGPVNCLFSWTPPTTLADGTAIPAGTAITYKLYIQTALTPAPVPGTTAAQWTGTTASADCNLAGWAPGFMIQTIAKTATPPGQLYAWVTAGSAAGGESALSAVLPFTWILAAPIAPAPPVGLTVK